MFYVFDLNRGIDPAFDCNLFDAAIGHSDFARHCLKRLDGIQAFDAHGLFTSQLKRLACVTIGEFKGMTPIPTRLDRWMRSKLSAITALTPKSRTFGSPV